MADSQLIDKKIIKRETDTALILDPKMTMAEELKEYLTYILQLPEDSIESAVETFRSASSKFL